MNHLWIINNRVNETEAQKIFIITHIPHTKCLLPIFHIQRYLPILLLLLFEVFKEDEVCIFISVVFPLFETEYIPKKFYILLLLVFEVHLKPTYKDTHIIIKSPYIFYSTFLKKKKKGIFGDE